MTKNKNEGKIIIDDVEYNLDSLSEEAKAQIASIEFVDAQLQQIQNELAISDTARIGYSNALKREIEK